MMKVTIHLQDSQQTEDDRWLATIHGEKRSFPSNIVTFYITELESLHQIVVIDELKSIYITI
jgi:hypothetical protein